jgi:hypothetical protein
MTPEHKQMADTIRWMVDALGHRIPDHWTDEQVLLFMLELLEEEEQPSPP